jgi:hypothetical protein
VKFTAQFDKYVCIGDTIRRNVTDTVSVVARLEFDQDTRPEDSDCYDAKDVARWKRDEWFYGGVVLSIEVNGETVRDHVASLWGIDCNFGEDNSYLAEVANNLLDESKDEIRDFLETLASQASNAAVLVA